MNKYTVFQIVYIKCFDIVLDRRSHLIFMGKYEKGKTKLIRTTVVFKFSSKLMEIIDFSGIGTNTDRLQSSDRSIYIFPL